MIDKARRLGVKGIVKRGLSNFVKKATDVELLRSDNSELINITNELEDGLSKNARLMQ